MTNRIYLAAAWAVILTATMYGVIYGRDILIPLAVAVMAWYLINAFASLLRERIPGAGRFGQRLWLAIAILVLLGFFAGMVEVLMKSLSGIGDSAAIYQENLNALIDKAFAMANLEDAPNLRQLFQKLDLQWVVGKLYEFLSTIAGNTGIILIYVLFLLLEQGSFSAKLEGAVADREKLARVRSLLKDIQDRVEDYIFIKTCLSVLAAVLTYGALKIVGVDFAAFWGLLVFLMNFIPTIGAILGVILPSLLALVQFPQIGPFVAVVCLLGGIQFVVGNILETKLLGDRLNLSSLVMLIVLAVWGKIWGVAGMFLCVPITVIIMIILSQFPSTRPFAIMLSANGKIDEKP